MKKILAMAMLFAGAPAFAQLPTDAEIEQAYKACNKPEHHVPLGTIANRPANMGQYLPEWKHCDAIESEWRKRDLAAKTKAAAERDATSGIANRLKGN